MPEWLDKLKTDARKNIWKVIGVLFSGAGVVAFQMGFLTPEPKAPEPPPPSVSVHNSTIGPRDRATVNLAVRDNNLQNILQGVDERDLKAWLEKLTAKDKEGREVEVRRWYEERLITANLREALLLMVERMDKASKDSKIETDGR
ncbi:MAG: hypothetical protein V1806_11650 [Pseudomonadota bacterium]